LLRPISQSLNVLNACDIPGETEFPAGQTVEEMWANRAREVKKHADDESLPFDELEVSDSEPEIDEEGRFDDVSEMSSDYYGSGEEEEEDSREKPEASSSFSYSDDSDGLNDIVGKKQKKSSVLSTFAQSETEDETGTRNVERGGKNNE
jgi:hypothetical protein